MGSAACSRRKQHALAIDGGEHTLCKTLDEARNAQQGEARNAQQTALLIMRPEDRARQQPKDGHGPQGATAAERLRAYGTNTECVAANMFSTTSREGPKPVMQN